MKKTYLTVAQASALIGASRTMVYYYIEKGLSCHKRDVVTLYNGKEWHSKVIHVDKEELLAFKLPPHKPTGRPKGSKNVKPSKAALYLPKMSNKKAVRIYSPHRKNSC